MTTDEREERRRRAEALGRAAERFGARVARDASRFARQVGRHAERFATELGRSGGASSRGPGDAGGGLGQVLGDVLENVDELVARLWQAPATPTSPTWRRVTAEREVTCVACRKRVHKGTECWRSPGSGTRTRCLACGIPERARAE